MNNESVITKKIRGTNFITHLLILSIILLLPDLFLSIGRPQTIVAYTRPLFFIMMFYCNYYFLIDRFFFDKKKRWLYFAVNVLVVLVFVIAIYCIHSYCRGNGEFPGPGPKPGRFPEPDESAFSYHALHMISFLIRDGGMLFLVIALSVALKFSEKWSKWNMLQQRMIAEHRESELKNLKNQLNPHFLFNTLNNIYSLIVISPEKAQKTVHELSHLLRYVLYENNDAEVELGKEISFISNYVELMRLRLTPDVRLSVELPDVSVNSSVKIAPLMFISLIENAFKHGVSHSGDSFIQIKVSLTGDVIECEVKNSYFPKNVQDKSGSGIGIVNLRRRLSLLYPGRHIFTINHDDQVFTAYIRINLNSSENGKD